MGFKSFAVFAQCVTLGIATVDQIAFEATFIGTFDCDGAPCAWLNYERAFDHTDSFSFEPDNTNQTGKVIAVYFQEPVDIGTVYIQSIDTTIANATATNYGINKYNVYVGKNTTEATKCLTDMDPVSISPCNGTDSDYIMIQSSTPYQVDIASIMALSSTDIASNSTLSWSENGTWMSTLNSDTNEQETYEQLADIVGNSADWGSTWRKCANITDIDSDTMYIDFKFSTPILFSDVIVFTHVTELQPNHINKYMTDDETADIAVDAINGNKTTRCGTKYYWGDSNAQQITCMTSLTAETVRVTFKATNATVNGICKVGIF